MHLVRFLCAAAVAVLAGDAADAAAQTASLTVFAASDLGPAFKQIVPQFERKTGARVTLVLGSTGMLAHRDRFRNAPHPVRVAG